MGDERCVLRDGGMSFSAGGSNASIGGSNVAVDGVDLSVSWMNLPGDGESFRGGGTKVRGGGVIAGPGGVNLRAGRVNLAGGAGRMGFHRPWMGREGRRYGWRHGRNFGKSRCAPARGLEDGDLAEAFAPFLVFPGFGGDLGLEAVDFLGEAGEFRLVVSRQLDQFLETLDGRRSVGRVF